MSTQDSRAGEATEDPAGYEVGYAKPPAEHRFRKGHSGNPKGRPKKPKNDKIKPSLDFGKQPANQMLIEEAYRKVTVREGDKVVELTAIQAVFRAMGVSAMKGNRYAQRAWAEMIQHVEEQDRQARSELMKAAIDYKADGMAAIEKARQCGLPEPEPLPHPDDIIIDLREGTVRYAGPLTPEEKVEWDRILALRDAYQEEVNYFVKKHKRARDPKQKAFWLKQWHSEQRAFDKINDILPARYQRKLENRSWDKGASRPGDFAPDDEQRAHALRTAFGMV